MKYYQNFEDGYTYYFAIDEDKKIFSVHSEKGKRFKKVYISVDASGYISAMSPLFADTLVYKIVPWEDIKQGRKDDVEELI